MEEHQSAREDVVVALGRRALFVPASLSYGAADSEAASRLRICSDRRRAIQLHLRAHLLHLRRQLLYCSLLLRNCRLQFCDRLFLHFAGHESRGRPENPLEKARKRVATRGQMTIAEQRASFDAEMGAVPPAQGCTAESFDLSGIPAEKITHAGAAPGKDFRRYLQRLDSVKTHLSAGDDLLTLP